MNPLHCYNWKGLSWKGYSFSFFVWTVVCSCNSTQALIPLVTILMAENKCSLVNEKRYRWAGEEEEGKEGVAEFESGVQEAGSGWQKAVAAIVTGRALIHRADLLPLKLLHAGPSCCRHGGRKYTVSYSNSLGFRSLWLSDEPAFFPASLLFLTLPFSGLMPLL